MKRQPKAYLALLFVCIAWGTTYLAIKVGVKDYPPFFFAAVRQVVAGLIIMGIAGMGRRPISLSKDNLLHQMLVGFLMITIGNGVVSWAMQFIPTGIGALICALMPVFAVLFNLMSGSREKVNWLIGLGMVLGFTGVVLQSRNKMSVSTDMMYFIGIAGVLLATACWALGSIVNKRKTDQVNPIFNSGLQLFFGGAFLFGISPVADNYDLANFGSPDALWALIYLIIVGSVLAYTAYMYALQELPVGLVTIYAYVNPVVAVILGGLYLNEQMDLYTGLAFASILLGVYLVNLGYKKQKTDAALRIIPPVTEPVS